MANLHCHCRLDLFWFFRGPFVWPLSQEHLQYNTEISTVKVGVLKFTKFMRFVHKISEKWRQKIQNRAQTGGQAQKTARQDVLPGRSRCVRSDSVLINDDAVAAVVALVDDGEGTALVSVAEGEEGVVHQVHLEDGFLDAPR